MVSFDVQLSERTADLILLYADELRTRPSLLLQSLIEEAIEHGNIVREAPMPGDLPEPRWPHAL